MTSSAANQAIAKFMRTLAMAAMELAGELEQREHLRTVEEAGLGTLQRAVAEALTQANEDTGLSPREVAHLLRRGDEPNVRTALNRLRDRGVAELIPELPTPAVAPRGPLARGLTQAAGGAPRSRTTVARKLRRPTTRQAVRAAGESPASRRARSMAQASSRARPSTSICSRPDSVVVGRRG